MGDFQKATSGLSTSDAARKSASAVLEVCAHSFQQALRRLDQCVMIDKVKDKGKAGTIVGMSLQNEHVFEHVEASALYLFAEMMVQGFASIQGIGALESSAKNGSLVDAKKSFVTAVSALQTWADDAGIAASLKGL